MSRDDFAAFYELIFPFLPLRDEARCDYHYAEIVMGVIRLLAEGCTFDTAARSVDLRGKSIINEYIDGVLTAFMDAVQSTKGQGPTLDCSISFPETAEDIESEKQLWVYGKSDDDQRFAAFRGCFGAGDGTLIPVLIKRDNSFHIEAHRNGRKGRIE